MPCHLAKQIYRNTPTFECLKNYNDEEDGDGDADDDHWPGPGNPFAGGGDLRHGDDEEDGGLSGGVQWHHNHSVITIIIILATRWPLSPICNPVWEQRAQSTTWSTRSIQSCKWLSLALTLESSASSLSPKEALAKIIMIILRIKVMMWWGCWHHFYQEGQGEPETEAEGGWIDGEPSHQGEAKYQQGHQRYFWGKSLD